MPRHPLSRAPSGSHVLTARLWVFLSLTLIGHAASLPPDLDAWALQARARFEVPGIGLAIIKDNEVLTARGYGRREMNRDEQVDADTVFNIASNSKAFTSACLALLVDEGRMNWDDPVTLHLPTFQMYDAWVTREITVRDLLTHRSGLGLGAGDLLFWPPTTVTREEIVHRQRFIKPASSFRSRYAYDNCLYVVAGQVVEAVSGLNWDAFVRDRIFVPLEMKNTSINRDILQSIDNKALSHVVVDGRMQTVGYANPTNVAAAGGINSSAADMAKWVRALLEAGRDGKPSGPLPSSRRIQEMWSSQTVLPIREPRSSLSSLKPNFSAYGLGFGLRDYRGHKVVMHGGGLPGQISWVIMVPEANLGVVLLSNKEPNPVLLALAWNIVDYYLNLPHTDWITIVGESAEADHAEALEQLADLKQSRATDTRPSLPLTRYAGTYTDAWYGDVTLTLEDERLVLRFSRSADLVGDLEHWQHDSFVARWRDRSLNADAFVYFALRPDGTIDGMKMKAVSPLTDFSYDFHDLDFKPASKKSGG